MRLILPIVGIVVAACGTPPAHGVDVPDAPGDVAGDPPAELGRYWARLHGSGTTATPSAVWFEYKPDTVPTWDFVPHTPERDVAAGVDLRTVEVWLYGLEAGTSYSLRTCVRDATGAETCTAPVAFATRGASALPRIAIDPANPQHFIAAGTRFVPFGNNYVGVADTEQPHQMVEDQMYDAAGLARIAGDLDRLKNAAPPDGVENVVRMHLQLHTFLTDPATPNPEALARFAHVIELAEDRELYVLVTGLNMFYPGENPPWVGQQTDEAAHWATQAVWWTAMANALHDSPGVFGYDLMNEPFVTGNLVHDDGVWWTNVAPSGYCSYGEDQAHGVHGTCFGQSITPDRGTRTAAAVAGAWTHQMVHAIRFAGPFANDSRHLVTVGAAGAFGLSNVFNSAAEVHAPLDFFEAHLYPDDDGQEALDLAAAVAQSAAKPLIAGETFSFGAVRHLIATTCRAGTVQGWIGQYDNRVLGGPCSNPSPYGCAFFDAWYAIQRDFGPALRAGDCPPAQ